jgi:hypothetical protein
MGRYEASIFKHITKAVLVLLSADEVIGSCDKAQGERFRLTVAYREVEAGFLSIDMSVEVISFEVAHRLDDEA